MKTPKIEVQYLQVFEDGSGIAATYKIDGMVIGAGWAKGPRAHAPGSWVATIPGPGRRRLQIAENLIRQVYNAQTDDWKRKNALLYADA